MGINFLWLMRLCRRMIYIDKTPEVMQQIKEMSAGDLSETDEELQKILWGYTEKEMKVGRVLQVDKYR